MSRVGLRGHLAGDPDLLHDRELVDDGDDAFGAGFDRGAFVAGEVEEAGRVLPDRVVLVEA